MGAVASLGPLRQRVPSCFTQKIKLHWVNFIFVVVARDEDFFGFALDCVNGLTFQSRK